MEIFRISDLGFQIWDFGLRISYYRFSGKFFPLWRACPEYSGGRGGC